MSAYKVNHINVLSEEWLDIEVVLTPIGDNFDEDDYISCSVQDSIENLGYTVLINQKLGKEEFLSDEEEEKIHNTVRQHLASFVKV